MASADRTSSSLLVGAPLEHVLDVVGDLEAYPAWVGDVREVTILERGEQGRAVRARFRLETAVVRDTYVLAYRWDLAEAGAAEVSWNLVESDVLTAMDGSYRLRAVPGGTEVEYVLGVQLRVPLPGLIRRRAEKTIIETALKGLRRRAEA